MRIVRLKNNNAFVAVAENHADVTDLLVYIDEVLSSSQGLSGYVRSERKGSVMY